MSKIVQGVQASVRAFVQGQSRVSRGLCRVCRASPYVTRARQQKTTPKKIKTQPSACIYMPAHPAHPAQPTDTNASLKFTACTNARTPCTPTKQQQKK